MPEPSERPLSHPGPSAPRTSAPRGTGRRSVYRSGREGEEVARLGGARPRVPRGGSVPFSNIAARVAARDGPPSGRHGGRSPARGCTAWAGFGPLAVAGSLDVAKGARGDRLLAGRDRPTLAAPRRRGPPSPATTGRRSSASPGGRGISPALGALAVNAPAGRGGARRRAGRGRLAGGSPDGPRSAASSPSSRWCRSSPGPTADGGRSPGPPSVVPIVAKRLAGNAPPPARPGPGPGALEPARARPGRGAVRELLARRGFRNLLLGQTVSALGDWLVTVALMVLVLDLTGSSTAVGGMLVLRLLPRDGGGGPWRRGSPTAGRDGGRCSRRTSRGRSWCSPSPSSPPRGGVYVWAFALEVLGLVFLPARDASVPDLAGEEDLPLANGLVLASSYGTIPLGAAAFAGLAWLEPPAARRRRVPRLPPLPPRLRRRRGDLPRASYAFVRTLRRARRAGCIAPRRRGWTAPAGGRFRDALGLPLVRRVVLPVCAVAPGGGDPVLGGDRVRARGARRERDGVRGRSSCSSAWGALLGLGLHRAGRRAGRARHGAPDRARAGRDRRGHRARPRPSPSPTWGPGPSGCSPRPPSWEG
ncbi:MAG: hypothetical protein KatS3mg014_1079 [Actinomycetota bacterium]|nr:MAG: hypothetical protein KatS3mg014_1079 [Actinomycetota bacterium]